MTNILVDLHRTGGNVYNGLYHFCYQLGKHLVKEEHKDMQLHFYVPKAQLGMFGEDVEYVTQRSLHKYYHFNTNRFDVWHVATTLSWYRPFGSKTKNIYTIHDLNFLFEDEYSDRSRKRYLELIQQRIDRADFLTFISHFAKQQAEQHLNLGAIPSAIIYNGCNEPEGMAQQPHYLPTKPFLFTIGQLHSRKNFHVLPALLKGNDYELVIAGLNDFPYAEKVLAEAKKFNVLDRLKLIGPVTDDERAWYYKNCLAFVFPSIGEGFGLPVLEAMYFGKPVFLANATSLPEVGGNLAYYFDDFDAERMQCVFNKGMQDYDRSNPAKSIIERAKSFSWNNAARQYLKVYRKFI